MRAEPTRKQAILTRDEWTHPESPRQSSGPNHTPAEIPQMQIPPNHHQFISAIDANRLLLLLRLDNLIRLCRLGIGHHLVLSCSLLGHRSLLCGLSHLTLLGGLSICNSLRSCTLLLDLIEVALGNWTSDRTDLIVLGLVDCLGGILALIVEPIL